MSITSADITKLRASTGAGMMDCKNALTEANGDMEKAADILRKKGIVKAAKRADKVAAEGVVTSFVNADNKLGALVEVNCETDFVAKGDDFINFAKSVAQAVAEKNPSDLSAVADLVLGNGATVATTLNNMSLKLGEKFGVRRFVRYESANLVVTYLHGKKIGILLDLFGGDAVLAQEVAMHIAASNPKYVKREEVDVAELEKEKEIYRDQLKQQGKPDNIIENILKGKMDKYYGEVCLLEQPFIKNEEMTVGKLLESKSAAVVRFARYELGEGIEKVQKDFAAEVAEQMK